MKIHKNLVHAAAETLKEIFTNNRHADKCLEYVFKKNPKWGSRDRKFIAEAVYDIVRYYRLYAELAQSKNNFWFMTGVWMVLKHLEIPDWPEFVHLDSEKIFRNYERLKKIPVISESYPDWLWEMGEKELGMENWQIQARSLNATASIVIRMNPLQTTAEKFEQAMMEKEIRLRKVNDCLNAWELLKRENVFANEYFKKGWFELQDAGSQMIGEFTAVAPGEFVVDACAGAGGKSLHLAALMKNKGKIISMDVEDWKLEECKKRARRAGAFNIETKMVSEKILHELNNKADMLLLDVPCSGSGVIKRNPDSKWKLTPESFQKTLSLQKEILRRYSNMVKPGGRMIYSTCSIFPSENIKQVEAFAESHKDFFLHAQKTILPSDGYDGFYMAMLIRKT